MKDTNRFQANAIAISLSRLSCAHSLYIMFQEVEVRPPSRMGLSAKMVRTILGDREALSCIQHPSGRPNQRPGAAFTLAVLMYIQSIYDTRQMAWLVPRICVADIHSLTH
jgi:hypothetical protein